MSALRAKYTPFTTLDGSLPAQFVRSSHCLGVHAPSHTAWLITGERKPREPVEPDLIQVSLKDHSVDVLSPADANSSQNEPWPQKRVGSAVAVAGDNLYLWGGRGGKDMGTFGADDDDLWKFDIKAKRWSSLKTKGDKPEQRSFHTMTPALDHKTLFLHAGCPAKGRLETLHALSLANLEWRQLASAPEPARGGTVITALPGTNLLARYGGFAGKEVGGLDVYDIDADKWTAVETAPPPAPAASVAGTSAGDADPGVRSVHAFVRVDGTLKTDDGQRVVAVLTGGEREPAPAELGHDGAGTFLNDAWALLARDTDGANDSLPEFSWTPLLPANESAGPPPSARGWFASSAYEGNKIVLHGGLNADNQRLGDGWILEVVKEKQ